MHTCTTMHTNLFQHTFATRIPTLSCNEFSFPPLSRAERTGIYIHFHESCCKLAETLPRYIQGLSVYTKKIDLWRMASAEEIAPTSFAVTDLVCNIATSAYEHTATRCNTLQHAATRCDNNTASAHALGAVCCFLVLSFTRLASTAPFLRL